MNVTNFWTSSGTNQGGGGDPGNAIGHSVRFRGNQYLQCNDDLTTTLTNQTWSIWFKRGTLTGYNYLVGSDNGYGFGFDTSNPNQLTHNGSGGVSNEILRDPSAWYHLVISGNSTATTQWINGQELTGITKLLDPYWTNADKLEIGTLYSPSTSSYGYDGYMAEIHFLDGQTLQPESFGRTNANGVWVPRDPVRADGTTALTSEDYGANGFHLDFRDPNNIGADVAPTGTGHTAANDFTAFGFDTNNLVSGYWVDNDATATSGEIPNSQGTAYWTDISPANADLDYSTAGGMQPVFDGALSTYVYWVGDEYTVGNVMSATFDLRDYNDI